MSAYYNEFEPYAAEWLRNLIKKGLIADGEVDTRSIVDVRGDDIRGFTQCHFFAGIGGWSLAARLAGWPDDRPLWTGSCPCQPFSAAGKQKGTADERHLWPEFHRLIAACRPDVVMGEQVAAAVGKHWLDGVFADLEGIGYSCGAAVVPACAVDAPHRRDRLWFVADAKSSNGGAGLREDRPERDGYIAGDGGCPVGITDSTRLEERERDGCLPGAQGGASEEEIAAGASERGFLGYAGRARSAPRIPATHGGCEGNTEIVDDGSRRRIGAWGECDWISGFDGKARRVKPGLPLLAHGVPARVGKLRAYGNAIVPQVAAEVIAAFMETH